MANNNQKIRITWDDLNTAPAYDPAPAAAPSFGQAQSAGPRSWGNVSNAHATGAATASSPGSLLLKGWFYLGTAGFLGAFLAWALAEPSFSDGVDRGWGNVLMFTLMVVLMCIGFGTAESLVERSWTRAIQRGLAALGLGMVLGFVLDIFSNVIFRALVTGLFGANPDPNSLAVNPLFWFVRAFAWAIFGVAGGLIFGIVSVSGRKTLYGMLGGFIGAGIGGFLFDPVALVTQGGEASRMIGMSILGACTGVAIGLVESALKDRWLYVSSGPLAGKQFVLYQDVATVGKSQGSTIYLFKDPEILDHHATIENRAGKSMLTAFGPVAIGGQLLHAGAQRPLRSGDYLQIGRYTFTYEEKERRGGPS